MVPLSLGEGVKLLPLLISFALNNTWSIQAELSVLQSVLESCDVTASVIKSAVGPFVLVVLNATAEGINLKFSVIQQCPSASFDTAYTSLSRSSRSAKYSPVFIAVQRVLLKLCIVSVVSAGNHTA